MFASVWCAGFFHPAASSRGAGYQPADDRLPAHSVEAANGQLPIVRNSSFTIASGQKKAGVTVRNAVWNAQENQQWRQTRKGWRPIDVSIDPPVQLIEMSCHLPLLHPLHLAAAMLMLVLASVSWSSDEWNWHRLVS